MYSPTRLALKYLKYRFTALNGKGHGVHSPFVFDFIKSVLNDGKRYDTYGEAEKQRQVMKRRHSEIEVLDFGAGSVKNPVDVKNIQNEISHGKIYKRKISDIAASALKPFKYSSLLFRIVKYYKPATIVELGTSLGITTSYLAKANPSGTVFTFEGSPAIASIARENFNTLKIKNIEQVTGSFEETLGPSLESIRKVDLVFMDGNHRFRPTTDYFEKLLPYLHEYSIVILDDIHWSAEMENAWEYCRSHPSVTLSIDLFFIGLIFFRKEFRSPQNFVIMH